MHLYIYWGKTSKFHILKWLMCMIYVLFKCFCMFWACFVCMSWYVVTIFSAFCHYGDTCRVLFLPLCFFFLLQVDVAWEPEGGPWLHPVAFEQWRCIRHKGAAAPWTSSPQPLRYGQPGRKKTQMTSNWNHGTTLIIMALIANEVRKKTTVKAISYRSFCTILVLLK